MKQKQLLTILLATTVAIASCKKKSNDSEESDIFKLEYSNLSTEQNKKELEKSGLEFIKEFNSLPDEKFIDVLEHFSSLDLDGVDLGGISSLNNVLTVSQASSKKDIQRIYIAANKETEKISNYYAIYTWNSFREEWVKSASSNKIEFLFPSDQSKSNNNAILTLTYEAGTIVTIDGEKVELPKSASAILKVDNKEELKIATSHEYKSDGTPTKTDVNLTLGSFAMISAVNNDGSKASSSFSLKKGSKTLLNASLAGEGKTTVNAIENEDDDIVNNANATFEVMNFKFTGIANVKAIINETDALTGTDAERIKKEAAIWNNHTQMVAVNSTENKIIAKVEFAGLSNRDCYDYGYWDGNNNWVSQNYCYDNTSIEPRLVFKDGSKQSLEAFTESGFSGVIDEMENLMDKF